MPVIAIVVPLFAHSVLVADALLSALNQISRYPFIVVVVNDGCKFPESDLLIKSILALHGGKIRYLVQQNAGLSAARNTGIDYVLAHFEALQAVYLLDADNAIRPQTIDSAYSELLSHPEASWVYPNIDMFGIRRNFDYGGAYSLLKQTRFNVCEAGSLIHRRVFDAGVRFDESMRLGYEDWDFWLSAAERGFRGVHLRSFGFLYRNRAESMLSQSKRDDAEICAYMRRKHRALFDKRNLVRLEAAEAPRYAVIMTDTDEVIITGGIARTANRMSRESFEEILWQNVVIPEWRHIPPIFIFVRRALYEALARAGLLLWMLHDCERMLQSMNFSCINIDRSAGYAYAASEGGAVRDACMMGIGRDLLCSVVKDTKSTWIETIQYSGAEMKVSNKRVTIPQDLISAAVADGGIVFAFILKILSWRSSHYRAAADQKWIWRDISVPPPHDSFKVVRDAFLGEVVYPAVEKTGRNIGFALSIGSFGGVERVAYNVARQFRDAGWQIHLFLLGSTRFEMPEEFANLATSVNFIEGGVFASWDAGSEYLGTALPSAGRGSHEAVNRIVAAMGWLDAVVNCHCGALNGAAAPLRKLGVRTFAHLHLLDHSPLGRSVGHAIITLAYEHGYDLIICNSRQLTGWMHAAGIPHEKLMHVPNAPGHSIDQKTLERVLEGRRHPRAELNVLYLGRLDRQKGLDRLAAVVERAQAAAMPLSWRIVGGAVAEESRLPPVLAPFHEPATFERSTLVSLFSWADVMILLSDYEGVPLSVLEARRSGVIVIATRVGALSEIIESGKTGFLVEPDDAVEESIRILEILCNVPALRPVIADAAAQVIGWPETTAPLIRRVTALVDGAHAPVGLVGTNDAVPNAP